MLVYPVTFVILSFSLLLFFSSWVYSVLDVYLSCLPDTAVFLCCPVSVILFSVYFLFGFLMCLFQIFPHCFHLFSPVSVSSHSAMHIMSSNVLLLIILGFSFCFLLRSLNFFTFASAFCSLCLPFVLELDPLSWHLTVKIQLTIIVNKYTANDS